MKTKPWESKVPQIPTLKYRKKLFMLWKKILNKQTYTHWTVVGYKWLTPKEITYYSMLADYRLEEVLSKELINEGKMIFPLDSTEWLMHK